MPITITCPDCDARIRAPDSMEGRPVRCPKCAAHFTAAASPDPPPAPPRDETPLPAPSAVTAPALPPVSPAVDDRPAAVWSELPQPTAPKPAPEAEPKASEPAPAPAPNVLADFLFFRKLAAPVLIQILFWCGFAGCVLVGGLQFAGVLALLNRGERFGVVAGPLLLTLGIWFLGPLVIRLACEVLVAFFRMQDALREIRDTAKGKRRRDEDRT